DEDHHRRPDHRCYGGADDPQRQRHASGRGCVAPTARGCCLTWAAPCGQPGASALRVLAKIEPVAGRTCSVLELDVCDGDDGNCHFPRRHPSDCQGKMTVATSLHSAPITSHPPILLNFVCTASCIEGSDMSSMSHDSMRQFCYCLCRADK
ncbi:hypothetical protein EJB05_11185, partial [Eragrostis curvula]